MKPGYAKMLQTLYDHEISFSIKVQWDAGFEWVLGSELECPDNMGNTRTAAEAIEQLWDAALRHSLEPHRLSLLKEVWKHD